MTRHANRCANDPEYRNKERARHIKKQGWTLERYNEKFLEQKGLCAICGNPASTCRFGLLDADHEHTDPPTPRGLLCNMCNRGVGIFKDDPVLLEKAAEYIRSYK
jgi:Recombination endonuclease VII